MGSSRFVEKYERREDPWGNPYYWMTGELYEKGDVNGTDLEALRQGYVSLSPIGLDHTEHAAIDALAAPPAAVAEVEGNPSLLNSEYFLPMIIDFHTHAFEDNLAAKAIPFLENEGNIKAFTDGRASGLLASMDRAGVERSVVCPIATKPSHFDGIRRWAREVRATQPRLEMLLSIHPDDPDALAHADETAAEGFKGVKLHPYYQRFTIDDERMFPSTSASRAGPLRRLPYRLRHGLPLRPRRRSRPRRRVIDTFPT
jgi:hypothetical protein